jgi:hypothetical protein
MNVAEIEPNFKTNYETKQGFGGARRRGSDRPPKALEEVIRDNERAEVDRKTRDADRALIGRALDTLTPSSNTRHVIEVLKSHYREEWGFNAGYRMFETWLERVELDDGQPPLDARQEWDSVAEPGEVRDATETAIALRKLQIFYGREFAWPEVRDDRNRTPITQSRANVRAGLSQLRIKIYRSDFDHRCYVENLDGFNELNDEALRSLWFRVQDLGLKVTKEFFKDAVLDIAQEDVRHPVKDYLDRLPAWDGVPRLRTWLTEYMGAENDDLNKEVGQLIFVAAIRRIREPGIKYDLMPVFHGDQGTGKSSAVKILGDPFVEDGLLLGADPKTVIEQTNGKWFVEVSELGGMGKREIETVKAMISRTHDTARQAYKEFSRTVPRQFVLIGTTNSIEFLRDDTGNRRFLPIAVGSVDLSRLKADRDQLWAEAIVVENAWSEQGRDLSIPIALRNAASIRQSSRMVRSEIFERVEELLDEHANKISRHNTFMSTDALFNALGVKLDDKARFDPRLKSEINSTMSRLGWVKERVTVHRGDSRPRGYVLRRRPHATEITAELMCSGEPSLAFAVVCSEPAEPETSVVRFTRPRGRDGQVVAR